MPHGVLKVAFASHLSCLDGGAQRCLLEAAIALKQDGRVEPLVTVPSDGALSAALRVESVRCQVLPTPWWALHAGGPVLRVLRLGLTRRSWRSLAIARSTVHWSRWLRVERPDVVVTNTAVIPAPALACAMVGIPHVWWVHEFVTKDHGLRFVLGEALSQRLMGRLSRLMVVNSGAVRDYFSPSIGADKMRVIYQGIVGFKPSPNTVDSVGLRVLLMGIVSPSKGASVALEAAGILKTEQMRFRMRLVGPINASYRKKLERLAADLDVADRVEVVGATRTPQAEFEWANVVLTCSRCEAFGRATVESLKSGRPVVGTRSGGTPELISDGFDGLLFTPGRPQELAAALRRVAEEPGLLATLSKNAGVGTRDRFTIESEVDELVAVLRAAAAQETLDARKARR